MVDTDRDLETQAPGWPPEQAELFCESYLPLIGPYLQGEIPEPNFLIRGLLARKSITLLVGETGANKSWIAYDLLRAIASGTPWLGKAESTTLGQRLPVVLFNYDTPTDEIVRRFMLLGVHESFPIRVHSAGITKPPPKLPEILRLPMTLEPIAEMIRHLDPAVVVFDSLRQAHTGNEQDSQTMGEVMSCFRVIADLGPAVVVLHHTAKNPGDGAGWEAAARGSGEILAHADTAIESRKNGQLVWTKHRGWSMKSKICKYELITSIVDERELITVQLTSAPPGVSQAAIDTANIIGVLQREGPMGVDEIAKASKAGRKTVSEILDKLIGKNVVRRKPRSGPLAPRVFELVEAPKNDQTVL